MITIPGIPANAGIQNEYARDIQRLMRGLEKVVIQFALEKYKQFRQAELITSDAPTDFDNWRLQQLIDAIKNHFGKYIDTWDVEDIDAIARKFIGRIDKQTKAGLMANLKAAGIVIDFKVSALHQPLLEELIATNVNLIKSIAPTYLDKLTNVVVDSALKGRDMGSIYKHITKLNKVTNRRAELIAIDQTNKATQALNIIRSESIGIKSGIWIHIPGEKSSRETHIEMNGKVFNLSEGLHDDAVGRYVLPGELPYCRCDFRPNITELLTEQKQ